MSVDCIFCRVIRGEVPSKEVLSTKSTYAFRDIEPQAPIHVLVVPRLHLESADYLDETHGEVLGGLFEAARTVAAKEGLSPRQGGNGYRLIMNVGDDAGNTVPHLHLHVLGGSKLGSSAG